MIQRAGPKKFPSWLRGLGWLAFGVLALASLLVITRWLVMNSGHQATKRIVSAQRKSVPGKKPEVRPSAAPAVSKIPEAKVPGMPLASIPHFGKALTGDKQEWNEFSKKLEEVRLFLQHGVHRQSEDGVLNFRAILPSMGIDVPENMTAAEAAAEYLRRAEHFSPLLAQWREAVAAGPLEAAPDPKTDPDAWRFGSISLSIPRLLAMTAEARLQTGDTAGAWADWQTMNNYTARKLEYYGSDYGASMDFLTMDLAQSGVRSGAWSDEQLAEISSVVARQNALAAKQLGLEDQKKFVTDYYMNFHDHEEQFAKDLLETPSPFNQMVNQVKLKLITEQQIRDNMDVRLAEIDNQLARFDPETGFYVRPTEEELREAAENKERPGIFGSFYFMINDLHGGSGDDQRLAGYVIRQQSEYDQFRLAAALETYQRQNGEYPEHLDAVSGGLPGGAPLDIATGQPYFYQRNPDGGYTLWGTGIDGKSDGGDAKADVTWKHGPAKSK